MILVHKDLCLQVRITRQERPEELDAVFNVVCSACLANGMHT